ncbi:group II truncated hemoglobin [Acidocella sp.]|uniref:group II truncated hemoglobin n=1 Tax=Acidocella sp. TaxID=50710 RepID=UPI0025C2F553|nr:group II truncated hemoglobin [Acidocella sp.]
MTEQTLFMRLGGAEAVVRLVDEFYNNMEQRPEFAATRALHAPYLAATRDVLKLYLMEWTGGPASYSSAKGHPRLRRRHMHIRIGAAERDDWMNCMSAALTSAVANAEARAEITENFANLADWMRNQAGNPHDAGQSFAGTGVHEPAPADCMHVANSTVENPTKSGCTPSEA